MSEDDDERSGERSGCLEGCYVNPSGQSLFIVYGVSAAAAALYSMPVGGPKDNQHHGEYE
jgi:hypothetical protein